MQKIIAQIAQEIRVRPDQVLTAVELLDGGATVPFIARYRKEATGGLDDVQLRELEARLSYLREVREVCFAPNEHDHYGVKVCAKLMIEHDQKV